MQNKNIYKKKNEEPVLFAAGNEETKKKPNKKNTRKRTVCLLFKTGNRIWMQPTPTTTLNIS